MGSLGPTHLISLLLAVAVIAATYRFIASATARRNSRRAQGFFLLGFFCGLMSGAILRGTRFGLNSLGAVARCADVRQLGSAYVARSSFRCSRAHSCGITGSAGIVAAAVASPEGAAVPLGMRAITRRDASQNAERINRTDEGGDAELVRSSAPLIRLTGSRNFVADSRPCDSITQ
jgi:hypothetical protein